jgi:hypothetical protein
LPGEPLLPTPMREFPVINSNAHAAPLFALLRVLGLEATPERIASVRPAPAAAGPWRLVTPEGTWEGGAPPR